MKKLLAALLLFSVPARADVVPLDQLKQNVSSAIVPNGRGQITANTLAPLMINMIDSIAASNIPLLTLQSNCFWRANGPTTPASCESINAAFSSIRLSDIPGTTGVIYNVADFLTPAQRADVASGNPTLDLYSAVQSVENLLPTSGGTLFFPDGVWRWDQTVRLSGNRHIRCSPGAVFRPIYRFTIFANDKYASTALLTDKTLPIDANQTERNFSIEGCTFDSRALTAALSPFPIGTYDGSNGARFLLAQNVRFANNRFIGTSPTVDQFMTGASCIGSKFCSFENNLIEGINLGFDVWGGSRYVTIKNNTIVLTDNSGPQYENSYCIGVNGVGTPLDFHLSTTDIEVEGNKCVTKSKEECIQFSPLSSGSTVERIKILNNSCVAESGTLNGGIWAFGRIRDVLIAGNTIKGSDRRPINLVDYNGFDETFSGNNNITTTNGSNLVTVADTSFTNLKVVVGNYINFTAASPVGGITFANKFFIVTAVNPGVSVTVQADANATSGATGGGATTVKIWSGAPQDARVIDNTILDSNFPALIQVIGERVQIGGNTAVGGSYGAFTYTYSFLRGQDLLPRPQVWGSSALPGAGLAGTVGDNVDNFLANLGPRTTAPELRGGKVVAGAVVGEATADLHVKGNARIEGLTAAGWMFTDASGNISRAGFGLSTTKTVRDAAGTGTCTLIFTSGLLTGGTC